MLARPRGLVLHGTRSGVPKTIHDEYDGTRDWATHALVHDPVNGDYYLGWHVTVGEDEYSVHMTAREWGWNCGGDSMYRFAIEFAQWDVSQAITDRQVRTAARAIKNELLPQWGPYDWSDPNAMKGHSELPQGIRDGKTDTFPLNSAALAMLKQRLQVALREVGA